MVFLAYNNKAEYEATIFIHKTTFHMGAHMIQIFTNSKSVAN